jgi:hypothetical protein
VEAMLTGLSTHVYLQGTLKNTVTAHYHESSRAILKRGKEAYYISKAMGHPDFSHVTGTENNIRKNGLDLLEENAAAYGCTETKRARKWYEEVGPLNQRLNAGGAALRECAVLDYPMGQGEQLFAEEGSEIGYGYHGDSRAPAYNLIHKTLPELDFVDSVRYHIQILNTDCYIFDVPVRDTRRYSNLFLLRARKYLDHIYTEHKYGEKGFRKGTLRILRELRNDIRQHYSTRGEDTPTVSSSISYPHPTFSMQFFHDAVAEAKQAGVDPLAIQELERILKPGTNIIPDAKGKSRPCLRKEDVEHIWKLATDRGKKIGSIIHGHITDLFSRFRTVGDAIRNDDRDRLNKDATRIVAELPLDTKLGRGRADLIVFRREVAPQRLKTFYRPQMVVEVKTRSGFWFHMDYDIRPSESRARYGKAARVVPKFDVDTRPLTNKEWGEVVDEAPRPQTVEQIEAYANALQEEYNSIATTEDSPPVIKATLLIDPSTSNPESRKIIRALILYALEDIQREGKIEERLVFKVDEQPADTKMVLVVNKQDYSQENIGEVVPPEWRPAYDPLFGSGSRKRRFILHLSAASPGSSGKSAARISGYHHGMRLLHEIVHDKPQTDLVWLDLSDDFQYEPLAEVRLRLRTPDEEHDSPEELHGLFKRIRFEGLFSEIHRYLYEGGFLPDIQHHLGETGNSDRIIIVSGWDRIRESTPTPYRKRLNMLLGHVLRQIPYTEKTTILWFDRPIRYERLSSAYRMRCFLPFYDNSLLRGGATEIVWNLPCPPPDVLEPDEWYLPVIPKTPMFDDIRTIIQQRADGFEISLFHVPPLTNWADKFRTEDFSNKGPPPISVDKAVPRLKMRNKIKALALSLLPWLTDLHPGQTVLFDNDTKSAVELVQSYVSNQISTLDDLAVVSESSAIASTQSSKLARIRFRTCVPRRGKSFQQVTVGKINTHRLYRNEEKTKSKRRPSQPIASPLPRDDERFFFAQVIEVEELLPPMTIMAMENPNNPVQMLVGFFPSDRKKDHRGFEWGIVDLASSSNDLTKLIHDSSRTNLLLRQDGEALISWAMDTDSRDWYLYGIMEVIPGERLGSCGFLRAVRLTDYKDFSVCPEAAFPEEFSERVDSAVRRVLSLSEDATRVSVRLDWTEIGCTAEIVNADGKCLSALAYSHTANLVNILTLTKNGFPIRLDTGELVYWDRFSGIAYGELSIMGAMAETYIPDAAPVYLPAKLSDISSLPEGPALSVEIIHDPEQCPISTHGKRSHDRCWGVNVLSDDEEIGNPFQGLYTDRELYLLLSPKKMLIGDQICELEIKAPSSLQEGEGMVFRESGFVMRLLADSGPRQSKLSPGTYIREGTQKWKVSISASSDHLIWSGQSTLTGDDWKKRTYTFPLDYAMQLSEVHKELWNAVTSEISVEKLHNPTLLKSRMKTILEGQGFSEGPLKVKIVLTKTRNTLIQTIRKAEGESSLVDRQEITINPNEHKETLMDAIHYQMEEGPLSRFEIVNKDEFLETLNGLLD